MKYPLQVSCTMTIKEGNATKGFRMTGGDPSLYFLPKSVSNKNTRLMIEEGGAAIHCWNAVSGRNGAKEPGPVSGARLDFVFEEKENDR